MNKTNAIRLLENAGLNPVIHEYDTSDGQIDGRSLARKIGKTEDETFKTLVAQDPERRFFVFVVPVAATLDLKKAARVAAAKSIVMIPQKELLPLTGYVHGGCSPVGMKKQFPTFLDETAQLFDTICFSGGCVGLSCELAPEPLARFLGATFADLTRNSE